MNLLFENIFFRFIAFIYLYLFSDKEITKFNI